MAFCSLHLIRDGVGIHSSPLLLASKTWSVLANGTTGADSALTCTRLENRGSRVTVMILVGSPPQQFDVVVDTGSNAVLIPSCACVKDGFCSPEDNCYQWKVPPTDMTSAIRLTFGSGSVDAVAATDIVQVGSLKAKMEHSLLLMVRNELDLGGTSFEGILGLGLPRRSANFEPGIDAGDAPSLHFNTTGFLETARIGQFSVCLNRNANGVLRLGQGSVSGSPLPSVGKVHWGLGLSGLSVGKNEISVGICSPDAKEADQDTPCGAIPDSGTTLIMAPRDHIETLFEKICASWPRCRKEASDGSIEAFLMLLSQCEDWAGEEGEGLKELPALNFQLEGSNGKKQKLSLSPSAYIVETLDEDVKHVTKHLTGVLPADVTVPTGHQTKRCLPAFGVIEYHTLSNGPIWVLGLPLFYEYQVGYDLEARPASVFFNSQDCGTCQGDQDTSLFARRHAIGGGVQAPVKIRGPVRVPDIDTSTPL